MRQLDPGRRPELLRLGPLREERAELGDRKFVESDSNGLTAVGSVGKCGIRFRSKPPETLGRDTGFSERRVHSGDDILFRPFVFSDSLLLGTQSDDLLRFVDEALLCGDED